MGVSRAAMDDERAHRKPSWPCWALRCRARLGKLLQRLAAGSHRGQAPSPRAERERRRRLRPGPEGAVPSSGSTWWRTQRTWSVGPVAGPRWGPPIGVPLPCAGGCPCLADAEVCPALFSAHSPWPGCPMAGLPHGRACSLAPSPLVLLMEVPCGLMEVPCGHSPSDRSKGNPLTRRRNATLGSSQSLSMSPNPSTRCARLNPRQPESFL